MRPPARRAASSPDGDRRVAKRTTSGSTRLPAAAPRPSRLRELYDDLTQLPNVGGCYLGWKRTKGRLTRQLSVVVCVSDKVSRRAVPSDGRIPRSVSWKINSRRSGRIPTDVQRIGPGKFQGRPVVGAGDIVAGYTPPGGPPVVVAGTLGVAMRHPAFGAVVTTAAHVFGVRRFGATTFPDGHEPIVRVRNGGRGEPVVARVHRLVMGPSTDYALLSASDLPVENLYVDEEPLGAPYAPDRRDLGETAYVLTERGAVQTRLRGLHADVGIEGLAFRDLILTDYATVGGDSGACLVDADSRVMGLVEGTVEIDGRVCSAFTPVAWPFVIESGVFF